MDPSHLPCLFKCGSLRAQLDIPRHLVTKFREIILLRAKPAVHPTAEQQLPNGVILPAIG